MSSLLPSCERRGFLWLTDCVRPSCFRILRSERSERRAFILRSERESARHDDFECEWEYDDSDVDDDECDNDDDDAGTPL